MPCDLIPIHEPSYQTVSQVRNRSTGRRDCLPVFMFTRFGAAYTTNFIAQSSSESLGEVRYREVVELHPFAGRHSAPSPAHPRDAHHLWNCW